MARFVRRPYRTGRLTSLKAAMTHRCCHKVRGVPIGGGCTCPAVWFVRCIHCALAACCGFDLCHKYILYLYLYVCYCEVTGCCVTCGPAARSRGRANKGPHIPLRFRRCASRCPSNDLNVPRLLAICLMHVQLKQLVAGLHLVARIFGTLYLAFCDCCTRPRINQSRPPRSRWCVT